MFDGVWELVALPAWKVPNRAKVSAEEVVKGGRIDICIRSEEPSPRLVGIEVKTVAASATDGQLERYRDGLKRKFPKFDIQIAYLTPFNREKAGEKADSLETVWVFDKFAKEFPNARHVSWLDVADIPWDGNVLWKHHQAYIRRDISSPKKLKGNTVRNRELADFFGNEATDHFWEELSVLEIYPDVNGATIDLAKFKDDLPSFARSLVNAIQILLDSDKVSDNAQRSDKFKEELRQRFLQSPYRDVHEALFDLSGRLAHVWLAGKGDYGVRTAHKDHPGGVSLLTSHSPCNLLIRGRR